MDKIGTFNFISVTTTYPISNFFSITSDFIRTSDKSFATYPTKDFTDSVLNRLFSRKWSRKAQTDDAKAYTKEKVKHIIENNLPFIFCYCFGGYKHFFLNHIQIQIGQKFSQLNI